MKTYFSKRHAMSLSTEKLKPSFSKRLRVSIARILADHSDWGGWNDAENWTFEAATSDLLTFYGQEHLEAFSESDSRVRVRTDFVGLIKGGYPREVLDAIEAWFGQAPKRAAACEHEMNDSLAMSNSRWRIVEGEAVLIDSDYLYSEVQARSLKLMREVSAQGALQEYQDAIQDLQAGETKDAVVKAHKSVESVMKTVLGITEHATFGLLLDRLLKSDLVPRYYEEFFTHFERLALGAVKERNRPGTGHGQGSATVDVPRSLAEFAINLAGTMNLFILERYLESKKGASSPEDGAAIEDLPW